MYKDKFSEWGFKKNLNRKLAGKLIRVADERKPKKTEFRVGPKTWTTDEINKKCRRLNRDQIVSAHGMLLLSTSIVYAVDLFSFFFSF